MQSHRGGRGLVCHDAEWGRSRLDAATGTLHWRFDANAGLRNVGKVRNRGVTYWSDGTDRRILLACASTCSGLDAQTGKPVAAFGKAGRIDLREGLGREP